MFLSLFYIYSNMFFCSRKKIHNIIYHPKEENIHFTVFFRNTFDGEEKTTKVLIFEENDPRLRTYLSNYYKNPMNVPSCWIEKKMDIYNFEVKYFRAQFSDVNDLIDLWDLKNPNTREEILESEMNY